MSLYLFSYLEKKRNIKQNRYRGLVILAYFYYISIYLSYYTISNSNVIRLFSWFKYNLHYLFFLIKPFISFWCIIKLHCMAYYLGWIYASCFNKMEQLFIVFFYRTLS